MGMCSGRAISPNATTPEIIEQFKKDIKDIQGMTPRQDAATKYAARQVMAYLADAIFDGKGLPERGGSYASIFNRRNVDRASSPRMGTLFPTPMSQGPWP